MEYAIHVCILIALYGSVACSLNLLSGYTGLVSLSTAAFYGIGAYTIALLTLYLGWNWFPSLFAGLAVSAAIACPLALVSLRFRNDYFVIATLAFQVLLWNLMQNAVWLTQGPLGLYGIMPPSIFGKPFTSSWQFMVLAFLYLALVVLVVRLLVSSPYGRVLRAIREDELFPRSLGKDIRAFRLSAFVVSSVFASGAGALYAGYMSYIDPTAFSVQESIFMLAVVVVGGSGTVLGPLVGSVILVAVPEILRLSGLPSPYSAGTRQVLYGLVLVLIVIFRPRGVIGVYGFER